MDTRVQQMTLEEKASMLSGANFWNTKDIPRLGIPAMMLTDGPHGLRKQGGASDHLGLNKSIPATCFPTAATLACSWDADLLERVGTALGKEAAANDVNVILGPGLNLKRNPLCGRNFEYFSEDPYLSGKLAAALIRGIQANGVSACPKHFAVNSQETRRMTIDEVVDDRALRELYLEGFRMALQEGGAKTLMTSYNRVNGEYANENIHLLQNILYGEWGYKGLVVTDWGGENDRVQGLIAGNQLEMPFSGGLTEQEVVEAVRVGTIPESLVDESVARLLWLLDETQPAMGNGKHYTDNAHHALALEATKQSIVLLKNDNDTLPLANNASVAVIGDFAQTPRYQGAGSSAVNPTQLDNALSALQAENLRVVGFAPGFKRLGGASRSRIREAVNLAAQADTILLFLGLDESIETEGMDRNNMCLPARQLSLLDALRTTGKPIVVVLSGGAAIEMPWAVKANAILLGGLGGQAGAGAVASILTGRCNPSGKLTETYPLAYADVPTAGYYPGTESVAAHRESIFVGYRYFDSAGKAVAYPFGYGLSYTSFAYSGLIIDGNRVRFTVQNTGKSAGAEAAQLYISKKDSAIFRAAQELKGFAKIHLAPGEAKEVIVTLDDRAFSHYSITANEWLEEGGAYTIRIGASSRDIRLEATIERARQHLPDEYGQSEYPHYFAARAAEIPDEELERLLGRTLPRANWDKKAPLTLNDTIGQAQYKRGFGRLVYNGIRLFRWFLRVRGEPTKANYVMFLIDLPFRSVTRFTRGRISPDMMDGLMTMVNGKFWRGLGQYRKAKKAKG